MKLALVLLVLVGVANAAEVELPKSKVKLVLPDTGWTAVRANGVAAAFKSDAGLLLAVTRADVPNPDAWKSETKQAYVDQVERGIKAKLPGYKRLAKKVRDANGVPALDLEAKRDGGATVVMRVLLFRTYALSIAIEVPKGGDVAAARALTTAFAPPKEPAKP